MLSRPSIRTACTRLPVIVPVVIGALLLIGWTGERLAVGRDRGRFPPPGQLVAVEGRLLHLSCMGSGRPVVVVEAGAGAWSLEWRAVQERLAEVSRTCVYDRGGYGWSEPGPLPRHGARLARELAGLLEAGGESAPYVLVGHSLGGWIARIFQARHPERVAGIALVDAAHEQQWERLPAAVTDYLEEGARRLAVQARLARFGLVRLLSRGRELAPRGLGPGLSPVFEAQVRQASGLAAAASEFGQAQRTAAQVRGLDDLGDLPLLVLTAGHSFDAFRGPDSDIPHAVADRVWAKLQRELAELSSRSRHRISPDASHALHLDDPDFVISEITLLARTLVSGDRWPVRVHRSGTSDSALHRRRRSP